MTVKVTFHGACGIVTGSCFEVRTDKSAILIDCGMFQGTKTIKELNYGSFPFSPQSINALILTHAHIDHCGLMPKLMNAGYKAPIVATKPTADLLAYVLPDSGYVQETEVLRLNRRNRQRGRREVDPIYTREDGERCARHVTSRPLDKWFDVTADIRARFWDAGHILGAASVELAISDPKFDKNRPMQIVFSGDIGTGDNMLQSPPRAPEGTDYLIMESTYGDRRRGRPNMARRCAILRKEIKDGLNRGGIILIPAFAVERTQQLLFDLDHLFDSGQLPTVPVFVDSPLATKATRVFAKYLRMNKEVADAAPFDRANLRFIEEADASRKLGRLRGGAIIIAGSGMCDAGRIRHHLKNHLSDAATTVLLVGYQAPGTLGRLLSQNVPMVRIQGDEVAVKAHISRLDEYSGHADQEGLTQWVRERMPVRQGLFLVHGEEDARSALADVLAASGVSREAIHIPEMGETVRLTAKGAKTERIRARVDVAANADADWHNLYADTILTLRRSLDEAKGEKQRQRILAGVRDVLRVPR
ncbi:MAG: MBL fold metallo-hydrolase RNA specificity domain-containing protein [Rhodospirillaceae bacterium]